jgi:hypothetical protein
LLKKSKIQPSAGQGARKSSIFALEYKKRKRI